MQNVARIFNKHLRPGTFLKSLLAVPLLAAAVYGSDLSGRWSGTFSDSDSGKGMPVYAVIQQDGSKISGTAGPSEAHQMAITSGKIEGDHLTFEVGTGGGKMTFDLTTAGAELRGKMQLSEGDGHTANASIVLKREH